MIKIQASIKWIIAMIIPVFILMTAIRLLLTPFFLDYEYNKPSFPPDPYGFTTEDRLIYSRVAIEYLLNDAEIDYLGKLKFPDSNDFYNERELSHMLDVKLLVKLMIQIWNILLLIFVFIGVMLWHKKKVLLFYQSLQLGGWLTVGLILLILMGVGISFSALFTGFHKIFFEGETWIFYYSDSLIRLFPMKFWQDAFTLLGIFTLVVGVILIYLSRKLLLSNKY